MKNNKRKNKPLYLKQSHASQINIFKRNIIYYLELLDCEETECILEKKAIESIYSIRNSNYPKIVVDEGIVISNKIKKEMRSDFDFFLSNKNVKVDFTNEKLSLKGIFKYLSTINTFVQYLEEDPKTKYLKFINSYRKKVTDFNEILAIALKEIYDIMDFFGFIISRMDQSICWLESNIQKGNAGQSGFIIRLKEHIPIKKTILIDENKRPIFPISLAFVNNGVEYVSVPSSDINKNGSIGNLNIQVFFQNHLFHRLKERLDCLSLTMIQLSLFFNVREHKIIEYNSRLLLEFRILNSIKLGYVIVEYVEGILLAKTFLLLTNSGTPEGEKLKENTGLKKFDLKYWEIDKLSTFQKSDIREHTAIREVFEKSGCGELFNEMPLSLEDYHTKDKLVAKQILQFIYK